MLNEQPPERRRHPLEEPPRPRTPPPGTPDGSPQAPRQQVTLRMPAIKPTVVYTLMAINIAVFLIRALSPALDEQIFLWGASRGADVLRNNEIYRLLTAMFLHAGIYNQFGRMDASGLLHIVFNMYALYIIGLSLEPLFGHVRFLAIYLLGGLTGSVLSAVMGNPNVYSVGASGAVFAILAAEFVYIYRHRTLLGERGRAQMRNLVFIAFINLALGAFSSFIDNWAHLGGIIGGLILTWLLGPIYKVQPSPENPAMMIGEDVNPLRPRGWILIAYAIALLLFLAVGGGFR
jgi:rhomboid protease GluP